MNITHFPPFARVGGNGSQSFTSLEELLNITGINAPDTRPSGVSGSNDNGVDSLHKMAQAVENAYQGMCMTILIQHLNSFNPVRLPEM